MHELRERARRETAATDALLATELDRFEGAFAWLLAQAAEYARRMQDADAELEACDAPAAAYKLWLRRMELGRQAAECARALQRASDQLVQPKAVEAA